MLLAWQLFLVVFDVNRFLARGPVDVWRHLTTAPDAAASRSVLWKASLTTFKDAFLGLTAGTGAAVASAIAFDQWKPLERTFMPIAMVLRSVPLVAMTPLIALVFGRDILGVTVVAGIVTFFPTLVNVTLALRSTPQYCIDLVRAYGASSRNALTKVKLPSALPSLFASLRVASPLALVGALLAEWLSTGKGLGNEMTSAQHNFEIDQLWAAVALVTIYSMTLYAVESAVEKAVLARFGPTAK